LTIKFDVVVDVLIAGSGKKFSCVKTGFLYGQCIFVSNYFFISKGAMLAYIPVLSTAARKSVGTATRFISLVSSRHVIKLLYVDFSLNFYHLFGIAVEA